MKNKPPKIGDLVQSKRDIDIGFEVVGIVMECRGIECKVMWASPSNPKGWWKRTQLKVASHASR